MASKKAIKKNAKQNAPKLRFTVNHALASIYVFLLFTIFPLFLSKYYSAARRDKLTLFIILTAIAGVAVGFVALANYLSRNNEYNKKLNTYRDPFRISFTDIGIVAFLLISVISTLASSDINHSFLGHSAENTDSGRSMGLLMLIMLFVCYVVISRFFFSRKFIYYGIFAGITVVVGLAILNFHKADPIGIFEVYKNSSSYDNVFMNFTSTIGNKNYLSALVCVSLMFSFGMAINTRDIVMRIVAFVSTGIQFMGLLVATSDGGFLGFFAAMAVILLVASRDHKKLMWYFTGLAVMMLSAMLLATYKESSKGYTSFSSFFIESPAVYGILAVSALLAVGLYILDIKMNNFIMPSYVFYIILGIIGAAVLAFIYLFIHYSIIDTTSYIEKDSFMRFFRYNDNWGTHRGFFWNRSFRAFGDMNIFEKLFGAGPESFYFKFEPYFSELSKTYHESSSSTAHNVYINYLITHGIVGLCAYLTFIGAAITRAFKNAKENPLAFVCLGVIVAYAAQDIVNIANPVNTPWFIVFIAISEACVLRANRKDLLLATNF